MTAPDRAPIQFGVALHGLKAKYWAETSSEADRLGFESVWVPEHLVLPIAGAGSPHAGDDHPPIPPDIPVYDALGVLCHLAALTTRVRLGTSVYNIGLRHPFITARAAVTVDALSGGRLLLGIGASWLRAEWDALGLDFDRRGARVDEAIAVCRKLWSDDVIEHHGEFFDFGPVAFEPKPVRRPGPPLHIGGDGAAALRRAATVGDGWMPMNHSLDQLPAAVARLNELAARHGRTTPIEVTVHATVASPDDVSRYAAAGVTRLIVQPWSRPREAIDGLRRFADEVASLPSPAAARIP